jgi:hypothetical protein
MTYQEFLKKFKKTNSFDNKRNYFISITMICIGLFFTYLFVFTDWYESKDATMDNIIPRSGMYAFNLFFILFGLYGFWRIPATYKFTLIESKHSIEQKSDMLNLLIADFKLKELEYDEQYRHYYYEGRFWNSFNVHVFFDSNNFYLNSHQLDVQDNGGFIDFGTSKRVTNKIKRKIIAQL